MRVGANVQPGQEVAILCQVEHAPTARAIVREAYKAGARRVVVRYAERTSAARPSSSGRRTCWTSLPSTSSPGSVPGAKTRPALIQLTGDAEPELFDDLDPALVGKSEPRDLNALYRPLVAERLINWAIVASPNVGLGDAASSASPTSSGSGRRSARRRGSMLPDPVAAWREHDANLKARSAQLNERRFDAIRFRGPGTELIGRPDAGIALDVARRSTTGRRHRAHRRTCRPRRSSRSPDWRRTEGTVRATMPLRCRRLGGPRSRAAVRGRQGSCDVARRAGARARSRASSRPTHRRAVPRRGGARGRRLGASGRPASCSRTRCSTRTRRATSPTARAARWQSTATDGLSTDELLALGVNIVAGAHRLHDRRAGGGRRRPRS